MAHESDLSGNWKCTHWYPSNKNPGTEESTENSGSISRSDKQYVFESIQDSHGSYFFARMTVDNGLVTGTWYEAASPTGEYEGAEYSGAFQALLDESEKTIDGKWAGAGINRETNERAIYTGRIRFERS